jgi:formylglycine-generating enzyme required for sulfatase activity
MDERPVTNAQFRRFVKAGVIELESVWYTDGNPAFAKAFRSQQT